MAVQRATFTAAGLPNISTDTKTKELVGDFKNAGHSWSLEPIAVNVHDYPHDALGRAVPYGVYDITANRGFIYLGTSGDTPAFAVEPSPRGGKATAKPRGLATTSWCWQTLVAVMAAVSVLGKSAFKCKFAIVSD